MYTQYIINLYKLLLQSNTNYIPAKNTNIAEYPIVHYNITLLPTMIYIAILASHIAHIYYAYKSKLYFLRNAMMIFCSLVKITIPNIHTKI